MISRLAVWTIAGSALLPLLIAGGCQLHRVPSGSIDSIANAHQDEQFDALWQACQEVLREHRFRLDRRDLRAGIMTTFPETSQHVLEFWRHDVDTPHDLAESTLHTVRRSVLLQISRHDPDQSYVVDVTVNKERFCASERRINNAAAALRIFSADLPAVTGKPYDFETHTYWTPAGRDAAMEQRLLQLIRQRQDGS